MRRFATLAAAAMAASVTVAAAQGMGENPSVGGAPMMADMTIAENAANAPNLSTLVTAAQQAGLFDTLGGEGPFTVFEPTDAAFGRISDASLEALTMEKNRAQLEQILSCHVVSAEAFSTVIAGMIADDGGVHPVPTAGGCMLQAQMDGDALKLRDENDRGATVTIADVEQSNGVAHVIDRVLLPAGQAG